MVSLYEELQGGIIPCIKIEDDKDFNRYGIISGEEVRPDVIKMDRIIEKPGREAAPSNFAAVGGYLFTPDIFGYLEQGLRRFTGRQRVLCDRQYHRADDPGRQGILWLCHPEQPKV